MLKRGGWNMMKGVRSLLNRKGQSATEYILILAVLVAIILVVNKYMPGMFRGFIEKVTGQVNQGIEGASKPSN